MALSAENGDVTAFETYATEAENKINLEYKSKGVSLVA
jgi:hypothetical protein